MSSVRVLQIMPAPVGSLAWYCIDPAKPLPNTLTSCSFIPNAATEPLLGLSLVESEDGVQRVVGLVNSTTKGHGVDFTDDLSDFVGITAAGQAPNHNWFKPEESES